MMNSWFIKKKINQFFDLFSKYPLIIRKIIYGIYIVRSIFRFKKRGADLQTGNHFNHRRRYVYVSTPKVATTTILKFLRSQKEDGPQDLDGPIDILYNKSPEVIDYYKFCFVRNPWARVYSCWFDKISTEVKFADVTILSRYKGLYPNMPFEEFVEWLLTDEGSDSLADRHWISQFRLLEDGHGKLNYDFIGKLENFHSDFLTVINEIGFKSKEIKDGNRFSFDSDSYRKAYTSYTRKLVATRYAKDIALFDYRF